MTCSLPARCSPSKRDIRAGGVFNRTVFGDVSGTLNTEVEHTDGRALIGLGDTLLQALARNTSTDTAHAGLTLNGVKANWHWTLTGNADLAHTITSTERDEGDAANDRALENTASGDVKATANGNLFSLPAATPARPSCFPEVRFISIPSTGRRASPIRDRSGVRPAKLQ